MKITGTNTQQTQITSVQKKDISELPKINDSQSQTYVPKDWITPLYKPKLTLKTAQISMGSS